MSFADAIQRAIKKKKAEEALVKEAATEDLDSGEKILFTGLDNSGKTSIILALQNKYSKIATLQPTRQTERSAFSYLGNRITRWDLGGQQRYRMAYLKNPSKYFDRTAICVFVIDVQDKDRVDEAINYFNEVLTRLRALNLKPPVYVLLHKADPEWMQSVPDYQAAFVENLEKRFKAHAGVDFQLFFQITSIFDPWTVISSFSEILLHLYPKSQLVDRSIQEFANKLHADGMVVLDNNALILGQYYHDPDQKVAFETVMPYVLQLFENFRAVYKKNAKMSVQLSSAEYLFHSVTDPLRSEERYLFLKAPLKEVNVDDITDFGNVLVDLLGKK